MVFVEELQTGVIEVCRSLIFDESLHGTLSKIFCDQWLDIMAVTKTKQGHEATPSEDIHVGEPFSKCDSMEFAECELSGDKQLSNTARVLCFEDNCSGSLSNNTTIDKQSNKIDIAPLYKIIEIFRFPSGEENGAFVGIFMNESLISIALVKCYGKNELSSRSVTVSANLDMHIEHRLQLATETLSKFIEDLSMTNTRMTLGVTHRLQGVPDNFCPTVKEMFRRVANLKNVFCVGNTISPLVSILMLGVYKNPKVKFALEVDDDVTIGIIRTVLLPSGIRKRTIISIDADTLMSPEVVDLYRGVYDDQYQYAKALITGAGLPEIFRRYLIEAIKRSHILKGVINLQIKTPGAFLLSDMIDIERKDGSHLDDFTCCQSVFQKFGYERVSEEDCKQIQFINRAIFRRACAILAAITVSLARRFTKESADIAIGGSLLLYPHFLFYLTKYVNLIKPSWLEISFTPISNSDLPVGAGVYASLGAQEIIQKEEALRSLPFFQIFECSKSSSRKEGK